MRPELGRGEGAARMEGNLRRGEEGSLRGSAEAWHEPIGLGDGGAQAEGRGGAG